MLIEMLILVKLRYSVRGRELIIILSKIGEKQSKMIAIMSDLEKDSL